MEEEIIIIEEPEQVVEIIDAEAESEKAVVVTPESEIKRFESELAAVDTRITAIEDFNDGITFDLIEDSAIDREKRIPTDAKMAKVKKIGGMSQRIGDELITAKVESVKVTGKNIFNWAKWSGMECNNNGIAVYNDANRSMTITAQDKVDAYTRFDPGSFGTWLKAKPNTKYTLSWKPTATATGKAFLFENGTTANMISAFNNVGKVTLTTTNSAEFLTIRVGAQNAGTTVKWENLQIEEGDTATDYEEFKTEKTIELSSRLKEIELYGISEDVHDYIDLEKKILVRMCRINGEIVEPLASPIVSDISYIIDDEPIEQPFNCKDGYISFEQAQAIKLDIPNTIDFYVKGASPKVIADFKITEETGSIEVKLDDNYKRLIVLLNDDKAVTFATSYNLYFGYANAKRDRSSTSFLGMSLQSGARVFSATIDKYGDLYSMISSHTTDVNYAQTGVFVTRTKTDTSVFMEKGSYFNINGNWDKSKLFPAGMSVKILGVK